MDLVHQFLVFADYLLHLSELGVGSLLHTVIFLGESLHLLAKLVLLLQGQFDRLNLVEVGCCVFYHMPHFLVQTHDSLVERRQYLGHELPQSLLNFER